MKGWPTGFNRPLSWQETRQLVFERDDYTCRYCDIRHFPRFREPRWKGDRQTGLLHVDHVVPRSRGGSDALANLVTACVPCNLRKHTSTWHPNMLPGEPEPIYEDDIADEVAAWDRLSATADAVGL